jgi:drug/metabolite transporter (DMT)-like permease
VSRRGGAPPPSAGVAPAGRAKGYAFVVVSYLVMGSIGALVNLSRAPESMLLVLRMGIAGLVLGVLFTRRGSLRELRQPGVPLRLAAMVFFDAGGLLLFFTALRITNVAIGMFLLFMSPIWVAMLAPRLLRQRTDPWVYPAVAAAFVGLVVILVPDMIGGSVHISAIGVAVALSAGFFYTGFMLTMGWLTKRVRSATLVTCESILDALVLLPLALWQVLGSRYHLSGRDLLVAAILGVVCTAFAYTIWTEGVRRVPVAHASVLGYLEPLSAPLYALLLLGERPTSWTLVGGVFIIGAGVLVVTRGGGQVGELEAAAEPPG